MTSKIIMAHCFSVIADRIKLFADGALGASTAALSINYKERLNIQNWKLTKETFLDYWT